GAMFNFPDGFALFVNGNAIDDNCAVVPSTGEYLTMRTAGIVTPQGSTADNRAAALATEAPHQQSAYPLQPTAGAQKVLTVPLTCVDAVSASNAADSPVSVRIVVADANDDWASPAVFLKGGSVRFESTEEPQLGPVWVDSTLA